MGNCCSSSKPARLTDFVNRHDDPDDVLTAEKISTGLAQVATLLQKSKRDISIVAVGGAVNTLLLQSRATTSDVDFFYRTKTKNDDVSAIVNAAGQAAKSLRVGKGWLNNHTATFIEVFRSRLIRLLFGRSRTHLTGKYHCSALRRSDGPK